MTVTLKAANVVRDHHGACPSPPISSCYSSNCRDSQIRSANFHKGTRISGRLYFDDSPLHLWATLHNCIAISQSSFMHWREQSLINDLAAQRLSRMDRRVRTARTACRLLWCSSGVRDMNCHSVIRMRLPNSEWKYITISRAQWCRPMTGEHFWHSSSSFTREDSCIGFDRQGKAEWRPGLSRTVIHWFSAGPVVPRTMYCSIRLDEQAGVNRRDFKSLSSGYRGPEYLHWSRMKKCHRASSCRQIPVMCMEIDSLLKKRSNLCFILSHLLFLSRVMAVFSRCQTEVESAFWYRPVTSHVTVRLSLSHKILVYKIFRGMEKTLD
jgi:hypothetical protein